MTNVKFDKYAQCTKAVLLARVSSREQEQGVSIDAQVASLHEYCKNKSLEIVKEYIITESSTRGDREQYHEMLDFVKKYKEKIAIVVNCVDRLQRSYKDTPILDDLRKEGKIEIHFLKEGLILHKDSMGSQITNWNLFVLMANSYIQSMRDNVMRSFTFNWKQGKWQSFAPVGYMNYKNAEGKSDIKVDEDRAPLVVRLFEEYSTGLHTMKSLEDLAKEMHLDSRQHKSGKTLHRNQIYKMLKNPFYYGAMKVRDELIPHIYQPLITKELFDKVQDVLEGKSTRDFRTRNPKNDFIFKGLLTCSTCGAMITCEKHISKAGNEHRYLKCAHPHKNCNQPIVKEDIILQQLDKEVFSQISLNENFVEPLKEAIKNRICADAKPKQISHKIIQTQLTELKSKEDKLFDFYLDGKCTEEKYNQKLAAIKQERTELEQKLANIDINTKEDVSNMNNLVDIVGSIRKVMNGSKNSQKRELLNLLFSNGKLEGKNLVFSIRKPFDKLLFSKGCIFWWEWVDSNHLRLKPTDLQSAPALQLRRTPRTFLSAFAWQTKTARLRFATSWHSIFNPRYRIGENWWCGQRDSNPHIKLGRLAY